MAKSKKRRLKAKIRSLKKKVKTLEAHNAFWRTSLKAERKLYNDMLLARRERAPHAWTVHDTWYGPELKQTVAGSSSEEGEARNG